MRSWVQQIVWVSACGLALAGCNPVHSQKVAGVAPANLESRQQELEGAWLNAEGDVFWLSIEDAKAGKGKLRFMEKEQEVARLREVPVWFGAAGDVLFASVPGEGAHAKSYAWAQVHVERNQINVFVPEAAAMAREVRDGRLPGQVEDKDAVTLGLLDAPQWMRLASGDSAGLYNWRQPLVLFKAGR